jgi:hypothetical protein
MAKKAWKTRKMKEGKAEADMENKTEKEEK